MNYFQQIVQAIQQQYPSLTEVVGVGRQNEEGIIIIGGEHYGGITDKKDNYGYLRFRGRDDWKHERANKQLSSTTTYRATAELRLVVVHREHDASEFIQGLAGVLAGVYACNPSVSIEVKSIDQDRNRILKEETKTDNGKWNNAVRLARIDFTLSYIYTGYACDPPDLCGGGTLPIPSDCPQLCELINAATIEQVIGCLDPEKLAEVQDLVCSGGGPCDDGEYWNGGVGGDEVRIPVASGQTVEADPIEVTDVDGTTRSTVPNVPVVCEWKPIVVERENGTPIATVPTYPAGGVITVLNSQNAQRYLDANGIVSGASALPFRPRIAVLNALVANIDQPDDTFTNITIDVNVPVRNTDNLGIGGNVTDLLNPHFIPDVPVTDNDGAVATLPAPTSIVLNGQATSAVYSGGVITITPTGGPAPSGIAYRGCVPSTSFVDSGASGLDTIPLWQGGAYDPYIPANPAQYAALNPTDTSRSTLPANNIFGNTLRFTDTIGNRSSVGSGVPQRLDFKGHNWSGAVNGIIIDHYIGIMIDHYYLLDGSLYSLRLDATGQTWYQWLTAISNSTRYGYTDWVPIPLCLDLPHAYHANAGETLYSNFFTAQDSGNRCAFMTGESYNATNYISMRDSNSPVWIDGTATNAGTTKNRENNFQAGITNVFMIRMLTAADIAALTP
jgi:hypothetical protein